MKVKEIIELISNSTECYSIWDAEELINDEYDIFVESVADNIDIDRHRWYETSMSVYKCEDGFVGIYGVSHVYSEMMDYKDCDVKTEAFEVHPYQTISYK